LLRANCEISEGLQSCFSKIALSNRALASESEVYLTERGRQDMS